MNDQQQRALAAGLKALADGTRDRSASTAVEDAVMREMRRRAPHRDHLRWLPIAAALVMAVGSALWTARTGAPSPSGRIITPAGFVTLPSAYGLPAMESASIVRISVPVSALPGYGLPIAPDAINDSIEAELLIAQDGQPRAIRLVNEPLDSRSRP